MSRLQIPGLGLARAIAAGFVRVTDPLASDGSIRPPLLWAARARLGARVRRLRLVDDAAGAVSVDEHRALGVLGAGRRRPSRRALQQGVRATDRRGGALPAAEQLPDDHLGNIAGGGGRITPPYDKRGGVQEPQVAVWVPVAVRDPSSSRERFAMFIPYLWLPNPMSLATGRELFGYPKSGGTAEFPGQGGGPQTWKLSVFGLDYAPGNLAEWGKPLLEVVRGDVLEGAEDEFDSLIDVARHAAGQIFDDDDVIGDFVEIGGSIAEDMLRNRLPNVFLKQFRSVQDGTLAAFQQVTQADYEITRLSARPVLNEHKLTVHKLDSHPVAEELGLDDQTLGPAYHVEMDFNVGWGHVLWDGASR